jgi:hypothetical protein
MMEFMGSLLITTAIWAWVVPELRKIAIELKRANDFREGVNGTDDNTEKDQG